MTVRRQLSMDETVSVMITSPPSGATVTVTSASPHPYWFKMGPSTSLTIFRGLAFTPMDFFEGSSSLKTCVYCVIQSSKTFSKATSPKQHPGLYPDLGTNQYRAVGG